MTDDAVVEEFREPRLGAMHVMLDLLECDDIDKLRGWKRWYAQIKEFIVSSGMSIATHHSTGAQCELGHDYPSGGFGYTYTVYVLESHVLIHTTPESRLANVCVFFCNYQSDNVQKAIAVGDALKAFYGAKRVHVRHQARYS